MLMQNASLVCLTAFLTSVGAHLPRHVRSSWDPSCVADTGVRANLGWIRGWPMGVSSGGPLPVESGAQR